MAERLVSVVIPSYNYAAYLPQAVASVAFQSYADIELVIVDDASSDDSRDVIETLRQQYASRFAKITVLYHDANMGAHATINRGVDAASGELIAILNADDLYEKERFEVMTRHMGNAPLAFSTVRCIGADGAALTSVQAQAFEAIQDKIAGKRFLALSAVAENVAVSTGNLLFEKSLFLALNGFKNYKYVHDYDFFLRACLMAEPVFAPQTAYLYRLHGENSFTRLQQEGLVENRIVWLDIYAAVKAGQVTNPVMLENPNYQEAFYAAVCAEGKKKRLLWKLAGNPLVRAGEKLLKKKYQLDE